MLILFVLYTVNNRADNKTSDIMQWYTIFSPRLPRSKDNAIPNIFQTISKTKTWKFQTHDQHR